MVSKQLPWRYSKQALPFLLLSISTCSFSADPGLGIGIEINTETDLDDAPPGYLKEHYNDQEIRLQDHILAMQSEEVQLLHRRLVKPRRSCNGAFFYGPPGSGKTTAAHAVIRNAGFSPIIINPDDVSIGKYSETAVRLRQELDSKTRLCTKVGFILDESDKLFDHPEQENRDTLQTSTAFCKWIERYAATGRTDIIFIGTGNDVTHFPQHLLSRLSGLMFKFEGPTTPEEKTDGLMVYITTPAEKIDEFKKRINDLFKEYSQLTGRDLQKIYELADDYRDMGGDFTRNISADDINRAIKKIMNERTDTKYYEEDETYQQQADRHHHSAMNHQKAGLVMQGIGLATQIGQATGLIPSIPVPTLSREQQ